MTSSNTNTKWCREAKSVIITLTNKYYLNEQNGPANNSNYRLIEIALKVLNRAHSIDKNEHVQVLVDILIELIRLLFAQTPLSWYTCQSIVLSSFAYPVSQPALKLLKYLVDRTDKLFFSDAGRMYYEGFNCSQVKHHVTDISHYCRLLFQQMTHYKTSIPPPCKYAIFTPLPRVPLSPAVYTQPLLQPWADIAIAPPVKTNDFIMLVPTMIRVISDWIEFNDWDQNLLVRTFRFLDRQHMWDHLSQDDCEDLLWLKLDLFISLVLKAKPQIQALISPWWKVCIRRVFDEILDRREAACPEEIDEIVEIDMTYDGTMHNHSIFMELYAIGPHRLSGRTLIEMGAKSKLSQAVHSTTVICSQCFHHIDTDGAIIKSFSFSNETKRIPHAKNKVLKCPYCGRTYCLSCLCAHIFKPNFFHQDGSQLLIDPLLIPNVLETTICAHQLIFLSNNLSDLPRHVIPRYSDWFNVSRVLGAANNTIIDID